MKRFENPVMTIEELTIEDVITTSDGCDTHCAANDCGTEGDEY